MNHDNDTDILVLANHKVEEFSYSSDRQMTSIIIVKIRKGGAMCV